MTPSEAAIGLDQHNEHFLPLDLVQESTSACFTGTRCIRRTAPILCDDYHRIAYCGPGTLDNRKYIATDHCL